MKNKICIALAAFFLLLASWNCGNPKTDGLVVVPAIQYNKTSVLFSLSYLSNINYGRWGSPSALQQQATAAVSNVLNDSVTKHLIGTWTPVWGPVTFTKDSVSHPDTCISDNTMVLLKGNDPDNPAKTMYVLSMAGTVTASVFDWIGENLVLDSMEQWPAVVTGQSNTGSFSAPQVTGSDSVTNTGNYISQGIGTGLNILFNIMRDGSKGTLMEFLKANIGNSADSFELAVAGHSLGGALSPCVALSLMDNQSYWNPSGNSRITCYATAGFTPGNKNFASYFSGRIGSNFHGGCNNYDVAIHMYQDSTMNMVGNLYASQAPSLSNECFMSALISCMQSQLSPFQYTTLYSVRDTFNQLMTMNFDSLYIADSTGYYSLPFLTQFGFSSASNKMNCIPPTTQGMNAYAELYGRTMCFAAMTLQEHFNAYVEHYGIEGFTAVYQEQLSTQVMPSIIDQEEISDILAFPLIKSCMDPLAGNAASKRKTSR